MRRILIAAFLVLAGCGGGGGGGDAVPPPEALAVSVHTVTLAGQVDVPPGSTALMRVDGSDVAVAGDGSWSHQLALSASATVAVDTVINGQVARQQSVEVAIE
ncbi:MAG: hypothetical protein ACYTF0_04945 [Planctomycetota bacterium]